MQSLYSTTWFRIACSLYGVSLVVWLNKDENTHTAHAPRAQTRCGGDGSGQEPVSRDGIVVSVFVFLVTIGCESC